MFLLALAVLLVSQAGSIETDLSVEHLGDDVIFDITWPGSSRMDVEHEPADTYVHVHASLDPSAQPVESPPAILGHALPNELLGSEKAAHSEPVVMTTLDKEKYTCVLPQTSPSEDEEDEDLSHTASFQPDVLLEPLLQRCCGLNQGYWNYELCHGSYLKQYHEDKLANGQVKLTEYYLGVGEFLEPSSEQRRKREGQGREKKEGEGGTAAEVIHKSSREVPPTWYFNGVEYPYHEVELVAGTSCDLLSNHPRTTRVLYICDLRAGVTGSLLSVEEVHTCKYEAVVATKNLCQNKAYRLKDNPQREIQCYPDENSPSRPKMLREHELLSSLLLSSGKQPSSPPKDLGGATAQQGRDLPERPPKLVSPETDFIHAFLGGECIRGGSGWWEHEVCFGKYVQQIHTEGRGVVTDVVKLGAWDEEAHKAWFSKAGKRKQSKNHVIHLYVGGDVCDITGVARTCQVKYKCVKTFSASQVSLYLEEPTTCSYILTVEGKFVCDLLETTDHFGMFQYSPTVARDTADGSTSGQLEDRSRNPLDSR